MWSRNPHLSTFLLGYGAHLSRLPNEVPTTSDSKKKKKSLSVFLEAKLFFAKKKKNLDELHHYPQPLSY